jgi:1-deoxy-D-xylulose 5-phosphate reductoisomerase
MSALSIPFYWYFVPGVSVIALFMALYFFKSMMNAANEILVDQFLKGNLKFVDIARHIEGIMAKAPSISGRLDLKQALEADTEARKMAASLF